MQSNIFIPKTIKVGFQNRDDTYTKKLAYIIYYDKNGKLRKEGSWNSWRDDEIEDLEFSNEPTTGFVLNKKVGDYDSGWGHRHAYVRIYDSRNFEFEISVENLLYILENTNSIKGKGLEGEFVYGWYGKDLVLIPTSSPDYIELTKLNDLRHEKKTFNGKDLIQGGTYKSDSNEELIYLGRFYRNNEDKKEVKSYFFYNKTAKYYKIKDFKSLTGKIIDIIDENCVEDYPDLMNELLKDSAYSNREPKYDTYVDYTLEEFMKSFDSYYINSYYINLYYVKTDTNNYIKYLIRESYSTRYYWGDYRDKTQRKYDVYTTSLPTSADKEVGTNLSLSEIYYKINPKYLVTYDSNKKIIKEWK
jgi:hypothetical protein